MASVHIRGNEITVTARSILDYADLCSDKPFTEKTIDGPEWYGADSHAHALRMAREGSPKHREMMAQGMKAVKPFMVALPVRETRRDVAGERPDIGRATAGDPLNMVRKYKRDARSRPVTRWLVHMGAVAMVTAQQRINRGAAILALLDAVEKSGIRVEVELTLAAKEVSDKCRKWDTRVTMKEADQPLDIDVAAFCLVCPAVHRWLNFGLREHIAGAHGGIVGGTTDAVRDPSQVYFPPCTGSAAYDRPDSAANTVRAIYEAAIGTIYRDTLLT